MNKVKTIVIRFENRLTDYELPKFRGAVIATMNNASILFHNHIGDSELRYGYPLIQYKRIGGKAAIVCLGEGTEAIGQFFASCNFDVNIGSREDTLSVASVNANQYHVQVWDDWFTYHLRKWLPLNQEHYDSFKRMDGVSEKCAFLESILTGNILSFGKGVGVTFDKQIECKITEMLDQRILSYKGVNMMAFDVVFKSNVSLPDYIGLGKGVSRGMGTVKKNNKVGNSEKQKIWITQEKKSI